MGLASGLARNLGDALAFGLGSGGGAAPPAASLITGKQTFSIVVGDSSEASDTATITSVDQSLSIATLHWMRSAVLSDDLNDNYFSVELTNATTVTATRDLASTQAFTIIGEVLTFDPTFVKSVSHGTITMGLGDTTLASSSFNLTKANCAVVYLGASCAITSDLYNRAHTTLSITGSDTAVTVTAVRGFASSVIVVSFAIIEFESSAITSIQENKIDMIATETTQTASLTAVTAANTMSLWSGWQTSNTGSTYDSSVSRVQFDSTTQVSVDRGTSTGTASGVITTVEFATSVFTSVERLQTTMGAGETTTDVTLGTTLTDTSTAFINYLGFSIAATADVAPNIHFATVEILNTTTIRIIRNTASANSLTVSYEVIQPA